MKNKWKGFTLIELLVVIAIIGILAGLVLTSMSGARASARDAKRISYLDQIAKALAIYYNVNGEYPTDKYASPGTWCCIEATSGDLECDNFTTDMQPNFLEQIPSDPLYPQEYDTDKPYCYYYKSTDDQGTGFNLYAKVETGDYDYIETSSADLRLASTNTPSGGEYEPPEPPWACGDTLVDSRDSKEYATVYISGSDQCWMAENMNYGTMTAGINDQGSDCPSVAETEKYCYSDTEGNCTTDGALYQWGQAMCGATSCNGTGAPPNDTCASPVQGICPSGWHIPSHYEWTTLEKNVGSNPDAFLYDESDAGWRGTDEGGNLKGTTICGADPCWADPNTGATNSSGFTAWAPGYRYTNGYTYSRVAMIWIWSSLESAENAWIRSVDFGNSMVERKKSNALYGYSVRCLKD